MVISLVSILSRADVKGHVNNGTVDRKGGVYSNTQYP